MWTVRYCKNDVVWIPRLKPKAITVSTFVSWITCSGKLWYSSISQDSLPAGSLGLPRWLSHLESSLPVPVKRFINLSVADVFIASSWGSEARATLMTYKTCMCLLCLSLRVSRHSLIHQMTVTEPLMGDMDCSKVFADANPRIPKATLWFRFFQRAVTLVI